MPTPWIIEKVVLLSTAQRERILAAIQNKWGFCYNCMPQSNGEPVWIVPHDDLGYILLQSLRDTGISEAMSYELVKNLPEVVQELRLTCPALWDRAN